MFGLDAKFSVGYLGDGVLGQNYTVSLNSNEGPMPEVFSLQATRLGGGWIARVFSYIAVNLGWWKELEINFEGRVTPVVVSSSSIRQVGEQFSCTSAAIQTFINEEGGGDRFYQAISGKLEALAGRVNRLETSELNLTSKQAHLIALGLLRGENDDRNQIIQLGRTDQRRGALSAYITGPDGFVLITEHQLGRGLIKRVYDGAVARFNAKEELEIEEVADIRVQRSRCHELIHENNQLAEFNAGHVQPPAYFRFNEPLELIKGKLDPECHFIAPKMQFDAAAILRGDVEMSYEEKVSFALEVASGLKELHDQGQVHRDFKADNCGRFIEGRVIDLGCMVEEGAEGWVGNAENGAPEIWDQTRLAERVRAGEHSSQLREEVYRFIGDQQCASRKEDLWAFGIFLLDLFTDSRRNYFQHELVAPGGEKNVPAEVVLALRHRYGTPGQPTIDEAMEGLSPELQEIIGALLEREPEMRCSADQMVDALRRYHLQLFASTSQ